MEQLDFLQLLRDGPAREDPVTACRQDDRSAPRQDRQEDPAFDVIICPKCGRKVMLLPTVNCTLLPVDYPGYEEEGAAMWTRKGTFGYLEPGETGYNCHFARCSGSTFPEDLVTDDPGVQVRKAPHPAN